MLRDYLVKKGQVTARATFATAQVGPISDNSGLVPRLLQRLGPLGLRLSDMKMDYGDMTLSEINLRCFLFDFRGTLTVRAEWIEFTCAFPGPSLSNISRTFEQALAAVREQWPQISFSFYSVDVGMHGSVAGATPQSIAAELINTPAPLGPNAGAGCVIYYGPDGARTVSSLTVDQSGQLQGGLFIRSQANWDPSKVNVNELESLTTEYVTRCLNAVALGLPSTEEPT